MCAWNPFQDKEDKEAEKLKEQGDFFLDNRHYLEAAEYYQTALDKDNENETAQYGLGLCFLHLEKFNDAADCFEKAVELDPENHEYRYHLGLAHLEMDDYAPAVESFLDVLKLEPDDHRALFGIANAYRELGSFDAAGKYYRKALEVKPDDIDTQIALNDISRPETAAPIGAVRKEPTPEEERAKELANLLKEAESFEAEDDQPRAMKYYSRALSLDPQCIESFCYQARLRVKGGDLDDAFRLLEQALEADPQHPVVLYSMGLAYVKTKAFDKGMELFKWAVELKPDYAAAHHDLGSVYVLRGEQRAAYEAFQKAVELEPANPRYKDSLRNVETLVRAMDAVGVRTMGERNKEFHAAAKLREMLDIHDVVSEDSETGGEILKELNRELAKLDGMDNVKRDLKALVKYLLVQTMREEKGLAVNKTPLHTVFFGPSGAGKTTLARVYGRMLKEMGYLGKGHVVETNRGKLLTEHYRQTAFKVHTAVDSALHGILYIDDAHTLTPASAAGVMDTLLKRLDKDGDKFTVILSGEKDKLQRYFETHSRFEEYFVHTFLFEAYTPEEMRVLFRKLCTAGGFRMDHEADESLSAYFQTIYPERGMEVGNEVFVRAFFDRMIRAQALRIGEMKLETVTDSELKTIVLGDVLQVVE